MLEGRAGGGGCAEGWKSDTERDAGQQDHPRGSQPQKAAHPVLRNHLRKLTDLSASPGVSRTVSETSVQLCTPGWSRVPGEKMLSGKTPGSELGEQRQTHDKESQGGWRRGNHCFPGSVVTCPAQRESSL